MATRSVDKENFEGATLSDLTAMSDLTPASAAALLDLASLVKARPADFRA